MPASTTSSHFVSTSTALSACTTSDPFQCTDLESAKRILANYTSHEAEEHESESWKIWAVGMAMITLTAFSACIGILIIPLLSKTLYKRTLTFLGGIGVGSLSGSTVFIMLPQAFHITELGSFDFPYKSWMTLAGIYMLFTIDKIIKIFIEFKKARVLLPKVDAATSPTRPDPVEEEIADSPGLFNMALFGNLVINFIDGIAIGAAYSVSLIRGTILGIAIVAQQFPQEVSDLAILLEAGISLKRAMLLNLIPAALSYIGFAIGVYLGGLENRYDDTIFAVAAGMYFYICLASLIPEMSAKVLEDLKHSKKEGLITTFLQIIGIAIGLVFMFKMALITGDVKL